MIVIVVLRLLVKTISEATKNNIRGKQVQNLNCFIY